MTDTAAERARLERRRVELIERLEAIKRDYGQGLDRDSEEQAQQLENAEVLAALNEAAWKELQEVNAALAALPATD